MPKIKWLSTLSTLAEMNDPFNKQRSLSLPSIFSDHMVLQRNKTITVWGLSKQKQVIKVKLKDNNTIIASNTSEIDEQGKWHLTLPAQQAGGPFSLRIKQGSEQIEVNDVLIGDIWLASGQSNMEWKLNWQVDDWQEEVANSLNPNIRFFEIAKQYHAIPPALLRQGQWNIASPETTGEFSAVAWHFAKRYQQHTGIPLAIIDSTWGGTPAEAWTSLEALQYVPGYQDSALDMLENTQQWQQKFSDIEALEQQNQPLNSKHEPTSYKWKPGVLFNGMIHPLIHFPINGVIWYQGENNVGANAIYSDLFKALIKDWRAQWQTPDLPFLFVQLASYLQQKNHVQNSDWARLREAQASALTLPYTGMAVTIDIGDANDIHPRNKAEVGERLWRIAQHMVLQENVSYSGPVMQQVQPQKIAGKNVLVVSYKHIDGGLQVKGDQLAGFAIASTDGKFVHAQATIRDNKVIVSAPKIKQPVSLRYGWADNSPANLYNLAGLPALPFCYIQED